jgi:hypothetical protein
MILPIFVDTIYCFAEDIDAVRLELVEGVDEDAGGFVHLRSVPQVEIVLVVSVVHNRRRQIDYTRGWNSRNIVHQEVVFGRLYVR